jgi:hypothetical protein
MRKWLGLLVAALVVVTLSGCATMDNGGDTRLAPPDEINTVFLRYKEFPGEKVMVVAVDPAGLWGYGFDYGRETLAEAAESAATLCDKAREDLNIMNKAKIFAINDEVVYYKNQLK